MHLSLSDERPRPALSKERPKRDRRHDRDLSKDMRGEYQRGREKVLAREEREINPDPEMIDERLAQLKLYLQNALN